jgi:hypothetical protein
MELGLSSGPPKADQRSSDLLRPDVNLTLDFNFFQVVIAEADIVILLIFIESKRPGKPQARQ